MADNTNPAETLKSRLAAAERKYLALAQRINARERAVDRQRRHFSAKKTNAGVRLAEETFAAQEKRDALRAELAAVKP